MKIYLVGGAVRDEILKHPYTEKDYVVVGSTPEEMVEKKFKPVGKSFPVFLHPDTHEEYALARTEKKNGVGYKDFIFFTSPSISLEEDLARRDLTINAIAKDDQNKYIDPFNGISDINNKILRHVSNAFKEDPLRILRLARFKAKLSDFKIAEETLVLLKTMVNAGELKHLSYDRIIIEIKKVFQLKDGHIFFETLEDIGAIDQIFENNNKKKLSECFQSFFKHRRFFENFNLCWLFFQEKFNFRFCKDYLVNFSKKDLNLINTFKELNKDLFNFKTLSSRGQLNVLNRVGFFNKDDKFEKISDLMNLDLLIDQNDSNVSLLAYQDKLKNFFKDKPISIPSDLSGEDIAENINKQRLNFLESFQFE